MELEQILSVLQTLGLIVLGGLSLYFRSSSKAQKKAKEVQEAIAEITAKAIIFIAEAEREYKDWTGGEKFERVVDELYALIPQGLNLIIRRDMIEDIVQSTFDEVKEYLVATMDKAMDEAQVELTSEEPVVEEEAQG